MTPRQNLADHLAELVARGGEIPGIANAKNLVAPFSGLDEALNVEASADATAREQAREQSTKKGAVVPEASRASKTQPQKSTLDTESDA